MRYILHCATAGFLAAILLSPVHAGGKKGKPSEPGCGDYGTQVHFEKTPSDAARKALKEEKLVCVLHVSGDFEDPDFT